MNYQMQPFYHLHKNSDVATEGGGVQGDRVPPLPLTAKKNAKNRGKEGENQEKADIKEGKIGKKRKNREGSFILPLLTDRTGYATA